jgi:hypothetical protein
MAAHLNLPAMSRTLSINIGLVRRGTALDPRSDRREYFFVGLFYREARTHAVPDHPSRLDDYYKDVCCYSTPEACFRLDFPARLESGAWRTGTISKVTFCRSTIFARQLCKVSIGLQE